MDEPPTIANWWYVAYQQRHGPVSETELQRLLMNETLGRESLVWRQGMSRWQQVEQVEVLAHLIASPLSEPPSAPAFKENASSPPRSPEAANTNENQLNRISEFLRWMGYDLTPYGIAVVAAEAESGYGDCEIASHIALTTLALDVKEANANIEKLSNLFAHGMALLELLKEYKDTGRMDRAHWQNDANAIFGIVNISEQQNEWVEKVLSDPVAGKSRLATSRIKPKRHR